MQIIPIDWEQTFTSRVEAIRLTSPQDGGKGHIEACQALLDFIDHHFETNRGFMGFLKADLRSQNLMTADWEFAWGGYIPDAPVGNPLADSDAIIKLYERFYAEARWWGQQELYSAQPAIAFL